MKNLSLYHIVTGTPIILLCFLYAFDLMGTFWFAGLFLIYGFFFRPVVDYYRLKEKGLVGKKEFMKSLGFIRFKYYYELMFEK